MRPRFCPTLVNDRFGDPALHVDFLLERRAMLFDLGDISALNSRAALRLSDVFVSHTHVDHFVGFDQLLRLFVGREKRLRLCGPAGFIARVEAKLNGYTWNLADRFDADLVLSVTEAHPDGRGERAQFRLTNRFARECLATNTIRDGVILDEPSLRVSCAELDHFTPCLAFALQETEHVNVWRNRLAELGLAAGPWLNELKASIFKSLPDDAEIPVEREDGARDAMPLGLLRARVVSITPGQKIAYVTDAAYSLANTAAIVELAKGADILFIEAVFAGEDAALAANRAHLTTTQAGTLARLAGVGRVVPFHFSPRYAGQADRLLTEVDAAFRSRGTR